MFGGLAVPMGTSVGVPEGFIGMPVEELMETYPPDNLAVIEAAWAIPTPLVSIASKHASMVQTHPNRYIPESVDHTFRS